MHQNYQKEVTCLNLRWQISHPLICKQFIGRADYSTLKWINNFEQPKGQFAMRIERLSIFDFAIKH